MGNKVNDSYVVRRIAFLEATNWKHQLSNFINACRKCKCWKVVFPLLDYSKCTSKQKGIARERECPEARSVWSRMRIGTHVWFLRIIQIFICQKLLVFRRFATTRYYLWLRLKF